MTSRGWQMVLASLEKQSRQVEDSNLRVTPSTSASTSDEGTRRFNVFDVDPDDPFDVDKERQYNRRRKQDQTIGEEEDEKEIEENLSFSDTAADDDYIPNSASDSCSNDGSDQSYCVPMLSAFVPPVERMNNSMEDIAGETVKEPSADMNSSPYTSNADHRIKRPCIYCGVYQSQLLWHLKRKHANEEGVKAAVELPHQDQRKAFEKIRKLGIFEKNVQLQKEGEKLIRERSQGNSELTVCNGCKGFFNSKQIWRHKKICSEIKGYSRGSFKFSNYVVSAQDLQVTEDFKRHILDCFRQDEVGRICRTDKMVIMIGQRLGKVSKKRKACNHV